MSAMVILIAMMGVGLVFAIAAIAFICVWIYKDAKARGINGLLWVVLAIVTSPIIGILLYMLVGRKEEKVSCNNCQWLIPHNSNYCERCGSPNTNANTMVGSKTLSNRKWIAASIISFVLMIFVFIGMFFAAFALDNEMIGDHWNTGMITTSNSMKLGNEWKWSFGKASEGFQKSATMSIEEADDVLYGEISCQSGELLLHLIQGDKDVVIDVSSLDDQLVYPLTEFETGKKIELKYVVNGAEHGKTKLWID